MIDRAAELIPQAGLATGDPKHGIIFRDRCQKGLDGG